MIATIILVLTALAFAWSMGAHYTGACMGMPYATKSIALRPALGLMAAMTLLGATFLSHKVLAHIGHGIITGRLHVIPAIIVIGIAFVLTTLFTQIRLRLCRPISHVVTLVSRIAESATCSWVSRSLMGGLMDRVPPLLP